jgi:hypothetical protein
MEHVLTRKDKVEVKKTVDRIRKSWRARKAGGHNTTSRRLAKAIADTKHLLKVLQVWKGNIRERALSKTRAQVVLGCIVRIWKTLELEPFARAEAKRIGRRCVH